MMIIIIIIIIISSRRSIIQHKPRSAISLPARHTHRPTEELHAVADKNIIW